MSEEEETTSRWETEYKSQFVWKTTERAQPLAPTHILLSSDDEQYLDTLMPEEVEQPADIEDVKSPTKSHAKITDIEVEDLEQSQDVNEQIVSVSIDDGSGSSINDVRVRIADDGNVKESSTMTEIPTSVSVGTGAEDGELAQGKTEKSHKLKTKKTSQPSSPAPPFLPTYGMGNKSSVPGAYMKSFNVKLAPSQVYPGTRLRANRNKALFSNPRYNNKDPIITEVRHTEKSRDGQDYSYGSPTRSFSTLKKSKSKLANDAAEESARLHQEARSLVDTLSNRWYSEYKREFINWTSPSSTLPVDSTTILEGEGGEVFIETAEHQPAITYERVSSPISRAPVSPKTAWTTTSVSSAPPSPIRTQKVPRQVLAEAEDLPTPPHKLSFVQIVSPVETVQHILPAGLPSHHQKLPLFTEEPFDETSSYIEPIAPEYKSKRHYSQAQSRDELGRQFEDMEQEFRRTAQRLESLKERLEKYSTVAS